MYIIQHWFFVGRDEIFYCHLLVGHKSFLWQGYLAIKPPVGCKSIYVRKIIVSQYLQLSLSTSLPFTDICSGSLYLYLFLTHYCAPGITWNLTPGWPLVTPRWPLVTQGDLRWPRLTPADLRWPQLTPGWPRVTLGDPGWTQVTLDDPGWPHVTPVIYSFFLRITIWS